MDDSLKSRTDIAVLVGRFQVPDLHEGHRELIEKVAAWHKKFLLVLGCSPTLVTRRNPLDFQARKLMINAHYPEIPIVPLMDCADDEEWSKKLDRRVREVFAVGSITLYGGRDSFIPYYHGQFPCQEWSPRRTGYSRAVRSARARRSKCGAVRTGARVSSTPPTTVIRRRCRRSTLL
jgi:bifunctional NMN adenylyltransferase/nudix hydrolase